MMSEEKSELHEIDEKIILKLEAKVAELTRENNDLMTLVIPELQLDLKDALATISELEGFCERFINSYPDWSDEYEALEEARKDEGTLESHLAMKNAGLL